MVLPLDVHFNVGDNITYSLKFEDELHVSWDMRNDWRFL